MSEKRVVGIRGLDQDLYEKVQQLARKKGNNVAEIMNAALRNLLENTEDLSFQAPEIVSGQDRFELTAEALEVLNPLRIEDVKIVIILDEDNNLTADLLKNNLESIVHCKEVYVPSNLYYSILKKCKSVKNIIRYEKPWKEERHLQFNSNTKINKKFLERFKRESIRLRITVNDDLILDPDIPQDLFEEIVVLLRCNGNLAVSEDLYPSMMTIGTVEGIVQLLDSDGKPIDQIQFSKDVFGERGHQKRGKKRGKHLNKDSFQSFPFNFYPAFEGIMNSLEDLSELKNLKSVIQDGIKEAMRSINIDDDENFDKSPDLNKEKSKRTRVKPTKSEQKSKSHSVKIEIEDKANENESNVD